MTAMAQCDFKIEKFSPSDFELYFALVQNIDVMQMITERALSYEEAQAAFTQLISNNQMHSAFGNFKILDSETHDFIGLAKLEIDQPNSSTAELGYMLLPQYWGKGIATKVAQNLIHLAQSQNVLNHLIAIIDPVNIPSRKILINNGFYSKGFKAFDGLAGELLELKLDQAVQA